MADALTAHGLRLWLNVPVFHQPAYLAAHPDRYAVTSAGRPAVTGWLHMACPSREETVEHVARRLAALLAELHPTVVSLDFIRHFVYWEGVDLDAAPDLIEDGCYCPTCLTRFQHDTGERLPGGTGDPVAAAAHLRHELRQEWGDWKCARITAVADRLVTLARARAGGALLAIKTVPWREADLDGAIRASAGQDVPALCRAVDLATPMAFTHVLRRTPAWKRDLLADVERTTGRPVLSYVQTDTLPGGPPLPVTQLAAELDAALAGTNSGIVVFGYEQLAADPQRAAVLRRRLSVGESGSD
jgi:hypothetical protein